MLRKLLLDNVHQVQITVLETNRSDQAFFLNQSADFLCISQVDAVRLFDQERNTHVYDPLFHIHMGRRLNRNHDGIYGLFRFIVQKRRMILIDTLRSHLKALSSILTTLLNRICHSNHFHIIHLRKTVLMGTAATAASDQCNTKLIHYQFLLYEQKNCLRYNTKAVKKQWIIYASSTARTLT